MSEQHRDAKGELSVYRPTPDVIVQVFVGHLSVGMAKKMMEPVDALIAAGVRPHTFYDWYDMKSYESQTRTLLTSWTLRIRSQLGSHHLLMRPGIVSMGVSLANAVLGGFITCYTKRDVFDAALATAAPSFTRRAQP